ncbi:MAG TPA: methionyl-tRNA formyltransferase [Rubrivivax sp.]|nr:methionyl-tRNA formyltransferase [Rubrivivax sp.]
MRVGFAGTPDFARTALDALLKAGYQPPLVLTQPDRPAGRGLQLQASPVKRLALQQGLLLGQPRGLRLDGKYADDAHAAQAAIQAADLDVLVVAAYGLILPGWLLQTPRRGCINIHGSLLPRWRGAAPIQRAIEAGDRETGITIMQMDAGLDTGDMLLSEATPITDDDTSASLHGRLADLGARLVVQALQHLDHLPATPQPQAGATYAAKIDKSEAVIDWTQPALTIERRLRAFDPFPGCSSTVAGQPVKLWRGRVLAARGNPGERLPSGEGRLVIACGEDALEVIELQQPGGRRIGARDFVRRL